MKKITCSRVNLCNFCDSKVLMSDDYNDWNIELAPASFLLFSRQFRPKSKISENFWIKMTFSMKFKRIFWRGSLFENESSVSTRPNDDVCVWNQHTVNRIKCKCHFNMVTYCQDFESNQKCLYVSKNDCMRNIAATEKTANRKQTYSSKSWEFIAFWFSNVQWQFVYFVFLLEFDLVTILWKINIEK